MALKPAVQAERRLAAIASAARSEPRPALGFPGDAGMVSANSQGLQ